MADKTVGELTKATYVGMADLFVLEQNGQAKALTGQTLVNDLATALDGHGGIADIILNEDYGLTFVMADEAQITTGSIRGQQGVQGEPGTDGEDGRAITQVTKTGSEGLKDTYTIAFDDGTSSSFTVTNGSSIVAISKTSTSGIVDTYTVRLTDGGTSTFQVTNGNGISNVVLLSGSHQPGGYDTYRITFDNGLFFDFEVYNGLNGEGAVSTVNGSEPDIEGNISLSAEQIPLSESDSKTVAATLAEKQELTTALTAETALADADYFPFYDASASAHKKTLWSNIVAKIRTALFGTLNGFLKADGAGTLSASSTVGSSDIASTAVTTAKIADAAVTRAKLADDALYSPAKVVGTSRNIEVADLGCTLQNSWNVSVTYTLTQAVSAALPTGAEIAFLKAGSSQAFSSVIAFSGVRAGISGDDTGYKTSPSFAISDYLGVVAIRKIAPDATNGDLWVVIGNVEVLS